MNERYAESLKEQLKGYKRKQWPDMQDGVWAKNRKRYPHILPKASERSNILEPYRAKFWKYFDAQKEITLHRDFHHLNSSQAMCFNLFFPFMADRYALMPLLLKLLGIDQDGMQGQFERVLVEGEDTNFDFMLCSGGKPVAFFELKLSESGFGTADYKKSLGRYVRKYIKYYREHLTALVAPQWLGFDAFPEHYQILRNVSYLHRYPNSRLFLIFPKKNDRLAGDEKFIRGLMKGDLARRVTVQYLEEMVSRVLEPTAGLSDIARRHFEEFREKYVV